MRKKLRAKVLQSNQINDQFTGVNHTAINRPTRPNGQSDFKNTQNIKIDDQGINNQSIFLNQEKCQLIRSPESEQVNNPEGGVQIVVFQKDDQGNYFTEPKRIRLSFPRPPLAHNGKNALTNVPYQQFLKVLADVVENTNNKKSYDNYGNYLIGDCNLLQNDNNFQKYMRIEINRIIENNIESEAGHDALDRLEPQQVGTRVEQIIKENFPGMKKKGTQFPDCNFNYEEVGIYLECKVQTVDKEVANPFSVHGKMFKWPTAWLYNYPLTHKEFLAEKIIPLHEIEEKAYHLILTIHMKRDRNDHWKAIKWYLRCMCRLTGTLDLFCPNSYGYTAKHSDIDKCQQILMHECH